MSDFILKTDQYKANGHADMLPGYVKSVSSYFESRAGAKHPKLLWNGLQSILKKRFLSGRFSMMATLGRRKGFLAFLIFIRIISTGTLGVVC